MKIKNKTLQIRCDDELVTKLDMASKEYLGTRSDLVRKILELWILNTEEIRAELENDFAGETLG
jgi:metal-responsive CopG/Arc/MetJ family transcriptional regulator